MAPAGVVEALDVLEERDSRLVSGEGCVPVEELGLERCEEALGERVVVGVASAAYARNAPACWRVLPNATLVGWPPRSEWCTSPGAGLRAAIAMPSASSTSSVLRSSRIDQPTQRRLQASMAAAITGLHVFNISDRQPVRSRHAKLLSDRIRLRRCLPGGGRCPVPPFTAAGDTLRSRAHAPVLATRSRPTRTPCSSARSAWIRGAP